VRILSIDPAIRNTGFAVVEGDHSSQAALEHGVISVPAKLSQSKALAAISTSLGHLIEKWEPDEVAVEGIIYVQSHRTAISMGAARGAALVAAASRGLRVFEYAPRKVKQSVVGNGNADKQQVAFMVRALLGLKETAEHDAADALAIGLAHLFSSDPNSQKALPRKEV
jgi:crossover junction endodeoxyribonuclease RuvC